MLKRGKEIEAITEKIAALQTELEFVGKAGLYNLNKHCEGFIQGLLNIVYDFKLENLNRLVSNFPGLDLGDRKSGVAYQVTSESSTDKIEDCLDKVIRYKHYETFSDIRFFLLQKKQKTYPISIVFPPGFEFDPKTQIINFFDLLKVIEYLPDEKLTQVFDYVEEQTTPTISKLKSNPKIAPNPYVIDTAASLSNSGMTQFEHWSCRLVIKSASVTAPTLYKKLNEYLTGQRKEFLRVFYPTRQKSFDHTKIVFHQAISNTGSINHFHEYALTITDNTVQFEFAQYRNGDTLLTNLGQEIGGCLTLLYFLDFVNQGAELNVELDIDLTCNPRLAFFPQSSPYSLDYSFSVHYLKPGTFSFSNVISSLEDDGLIPFMERLIHGFVADPKESLHGFPTPFMSIKIEEQRLVFANFRRVFKQEN